MPSKAKRKEPSYFPEKREVAKLFNSECFVCKRPFGKGFTFHHLKYIQGEKTYRDFDDNADYQRYILPIVRAQPQRFLLLCKKHHSALEKLKRFKKETLTRLLQAVRMTKT